MTDQPATSRRAGNRGTDLSDAQLLAMGEIAHWAARAERTLGLVVANLVNKGAESAEIVINGMTLANLLDLGTRLVALRPMDDAIREIYTSMSGPFKTAMETRNHVLHSRWTRPRPHGPAKATLTRAKGAREREFTVDKIEGVADTLANIDGGFFILYLMLHNAAEWASLDLTRPGRDTE
jgi:hypothetical protein